MLILDHVALDILLPIILHFRLLLANFSYTVLHLPHKLSHAADALLRAPLQMIEEWNHAIDFTCKYASKQRVDRYGQAQKGDLVCA